MDDRSSHPNRQVGRERFSKALAGAGQNRVDPAITLGEYKAMQSELGRSPMWPKARGTKGVGSVLRQAHQGKKMLTGQGAYHGEAE
jgi:hypothetical protein